MMLTGVTEITRNASSASRGLVMISSRLTQVLDDTSSTGKKLTAIYADLGIELKDENGQLRSHYDILGDLAKRWDSLSENQQKYIALTSAGARQQQNFVALMDNWNNVAKATASAYDSIGSAQKENEKVMDSIAKKLEIIRSEFQKLVIGDGGLQDFAKRILDIGIILLKFANSDIGQVIIKTTALIATLALLTRGVMAVRSNILDMGRTLATIALATQGYTTAQIAATVASMGLADALRLVASAALDSAIAMATNPITLFITAIVGAIATVVKLNQVMEETQKQIKESRENIAKLTQEINLLHYAEKREAELSHAEKDRLTYLEKRLELEKQLLDTKEKASQAREDNAQIDFLNPYGHLGGIIASAWGSDEYNIERSRTYTNEKSSSAQFDVDETTLAKYEKLNEEIRTWNDYTKEGQELLEQKYNESQTYLNVLEAERDKLGQLRDAYQQNAERYDFLKNKKESSIGLSKEEQEEIENLGNAKKELSYVDKERLDILEKNIGAYQKSIDEIKTYQEAIDEYGEASEEADSIITEFAKSLSISEDKLIENAKSMHLTIDQYYEYASAVKSAQEAITETNSTIDGLQDALDKASTALEEYNQNGSLTIDTFQDLMSIKAEYLTALINENGQLEINQQTLSNLIEKTKEDKIEELQLAEVSDILAYAFGDVDEMSGLAKDSIASAGDSAKIAGDKAEASSGQWWSLTEAISAANAAASGDVVDATHIEANIQKIHNAYSKLGNTILKTKVNYSSAGKAATKAGKAASKAGKAASNAAKDAEKAIKDQNKALEEQKKKYETVIKWIEKQYDKEIDKIKKAKDEALDAEEARIKAKEKEKDKALDAIEAEINALKKEKDTRKKYWDDQIDALKKANQERKDSLELQEKLDALEKAKNTKVKIYKEGQGFVYDVDQTAVKKAKEELDEYLSEKAYEEELARLEALRDAEANNYEQRIDALEEYKDNVEAQYEQQIADLEAHKDELEKQYDAQIEMYENYKQQFEDMVNAYEESQNKLLAQQLTGIDFENNNWMTRLDNLAKFVSEYNKLQQQLETANTNVQNTAQLNSGSTGTTTSSGSGGGVKTTTTTPTTYKTHADILPTVTKQSVQATKTLGNNNANWRTYQNMPSYARGYASGTDSIKDDQIAIVGESPNQELVIGSKINNGQLMSLDKGTGIVNANSSKTLAGLLNQVGKFGASGFGSGNGTLNNNYNNDSLVINGVTIQGSNIKDPETFVNGLLSLKSKALQRAYAHK